MSLSPLEVQCAQILNSALNSTYGLVVRTSSAAKARATFYRTRSILGDATFQDIQIRVSPDDSECELWLIRKSMLPLFDLNPVLQDLNHA